MRWPETSKLIERIKRERPELTVDQYGNDGGAGHCFLRVCCIRKTQRDGARELIRESVGSLYSAKDWEAYKCKHPKPWCKPEEVCRTDHLGREVDHRGALVQEPALPRVEPLTAEQMFEKIAEWNRLDRDWWKNPQIVAEAAAAWGVEVNQYGVLRHYEQVEVARLSPGCHASVRIARTGSGLFTFGIAARWGTGSISLEPSVCGVPCDTAYQARRMAFKELIEALQTGRGADKNQQRQLLLKAVGERDRQRGLFD